VLTLFLIRQRDFVDVTRAQGAETPSGAEPEAGAQPATVGAR
jgi:hypothetical protein